MKYKPLANDMIQVKWRDAATLPRWVEQKDRADAGVVEVLTVGIFVERKKGAIKVALSLNSEGQHGDIISIPYSQVLEVHKLK